MQVDGTTDRVKVSIPTGIEINKEKLKFIISQNNTELIYVPPVGSRDIELTLMPPTSAGEYSILAVVNAAKDGKTWQLAGRLDVLSRTPKTYSVTLVPLLMGIAIINEAQCTQYLNTLGTNTA
jgi:hypothetical protein